MTGFVSSLGRHNVKSLGKNLGFNKIYNFARSGVTPTSQVFHDVCNLYTITYTHFLVLHALLQTL
jgi:hypothetical protein